MPVSSSLTSIVSAGTVSPGTVTAPTASPEIWRWGGQVESATVVVVAAPPGLHWTATLAPSR